MKTAASMNAAVTPTYGPADVFHLRDLPRPALGDHDVLVEIHATPVTAGDRRLRAADFPAITKLPGRLMVGPLRPRHPVQGTMFAGRVIEVGRSVTSYAIDDDVFGSVDHGAYAELLTVPESGAMANVPPGFTLEEAAAVPYGAGTALHFLRDLGEVAPGDHVLLVGASGGVGRYAIQIAKHLGATVTAVASRRAFDRVRALGADHVIDYASVDFTRNGRQYDVIFDMADATSFGRSRKSLTPRGRFLTLFVSLGVIVQMLLTSVLGKRRAMFAVALGNRQRMEQLRDLMAAGAIRPVIAARFPLDRIAEAHAYAESRQAHGDVIVTPQAKSPVEGLTRASARPRAA